MLCCISIGTGSTVGVIARTVMSAPSQEPAPVAVIPPSIPGANAHAENPVKMQRPFMDGDFEFVSCILHSSFHSVVRLIKKEKKNLDRRRGRGELESHVYYYSCFLFVFLSSSSSKEIAS